MDKIAFLAAFLLLGLTAARAHEKVSPDDARDGLFEKHHSRLCDRQCTKDDRAKVERCIKEKGGDMGQKLMEMHEKCDCACQEKKKAEFANKTPEQKEAAVKDMKAKMESIKGKKGEFMKAWKDVKDCMVAAKVSVACLANKKGKS